MKKNEKYDKVIANFDLDFIKNKFDCEKQFINISLKKSAFYLFSAIFESNGLASLMR
jgi:hypothetical protein